jgi:hypothetical protein
MCTTSPTLVQHDSQQASWLLVASEGQVNLGGRQARSHTIRVRGLLTAGTRFSHLHPIPLGWEPGTTRLECFVSHW